jgi:hypothetical protein
VIDERLALFRLGLAKSRAIEDAQQGRAATARRREIAVARTRAWKAAVAGDVDVTRQARVLRELLEKVS